MNNTLHQIRLTTVQNNFLGRRFIKELRQSTKGRFRVMLRGRGFRYGREDYRQDLPHSKAERFAVYLKCL